MIRDKIFLNLACAGINELIDRAMIKLDSAEDTNGEIEAEIFERPSLVRWRGIGHGELTVSVWWSLKPGCKREGGDFPLNKNTGDAVEACCTVWFERKTGNWIQCHPGERPGLAHSYLSKNAREFLGGKPQVEPRGFKRTGPFFL